MPLTKSSSDAAFKGNLKAELGAGKPKDQALAIAYRVQRDAKAKGMARGGPVGYAPGGGMPFSRGQASPSPRGIIGSAVPGRSDRIPMSPKGGSYVIPADVVSALGQGNTASGAKGLSKMFGTGPYGMKTPKIPTPKVPRLSAPGLGRRKFADGGDVAGGDTVDIMAAGGEFLVPPEKVAEVGGGNIDRGRAILDSMVLQARKNAIKTLQNLPGPRQK
jgi:hypothetical protein